MIRIFLCFFFMSHGIFAVTISEYMANKKGVSAYEMGDYQTAVEAFSGALSDGSESAAVYNNIGQVFYETEEYEQAEKLFLKSLSGLDKAQHPDGLYHLGNTAVKKEDYDSALNYYKQALILDPEHDKAKRNFEYAFRLKKQQEQQQKNSKKPDEDGDEKNDDKPSENDESEKKEDQKGDAQNQEQTEEEKQQELTEQMLDFLSDKERDAREKYKKKPVLEGTVEKDW